MHTFNLLSLSFLLHKLGNSDSYANSLNHLHESLPLEKKIYIFNHVFERLIVETYRMSTETSMKMISKGCKFKIQGQTVF